MRKILLCTLMSCLAAFAVGCTHRMEITNHDEYFAPPVAPMKKPVKLGIASASAADAVNSRYVSSIVEALKGTGNFERVIYPYNPAVHQGEAEFLADISINPRYTGSGGNFFVNWPGFLIFAPAIWGYKYNAELETQVVLTRLFDNASQQLSIPTRYTFRHAETNRTWTEIGWLEVGIIPLIGGFIFTDYDPAVTSEFITQVGPGYGAYVARKIVASLPQPVPAPAVTAMPTPVTGTTGTAQ